MAENETASHCIVSQTRNNDNIESISESEKSNDSLRAGVGEPEDKQNLELSQTPNTCDDNAIENPPKPDVGEVKADETIALISEHLQPPIGNLENNEVTEPVPGSSSDSIKQESDDHTVWLPTSNIKTENEDTDDSKPPKSEEDEVSEEEMGEEEKLEEGSDAEMDDESDGGAYHLAEVSYGEENEDSQNAGGPDSDTILGMSHDIPHSFLTTINNEGISVGKCDIVTGRNIQTIENPEMPKNHACGQCDYKTNRKDRLRFHSMTHTEGAYNCSICCIQTDSRLQLLNHYKDHKSGNVYKCSECAYTNLRMSALKEHFRTHTGEKPYSCSECSFSCSTRNSLKKHKRTHTGEAPYSCGVCQKRFKQSGHLTEHMRQHTGEKPFHCTICNYSCAYRCRIIRHMEMHSDEKPFPCTVCPYRAKNRATINLHMRTHLTVHTFVCDLCEYSCKSANQLKDHAYKHNGETLPFGCDLCKAGFTRKRCLIKHLRAHDGNKLLDCKICGMKFLSKVKKNEHMASEHEQQS